MVSWTSGLVSDPNRHYEMWELVFKDVRIL